MLAATHANCSHAVNDFRKLAGIDAYSPCHNVAELTARTNNEGWDTILAAWLRTSRADEKDAVLAFSVVGGNAEEDLSNLSRQANPRCQAFKLTEAGTGSE